MCRHLAYLGTPITLHELIAAPPHSLFRQSWAPRRQRHGVVNADGFGAGWYVPDRVDPVRYRRAQPIWTDASFASLAPTIASPCILAAVRSATVGLGQDEACAAPFLHQRWLFSHNGRISDWPWSRKVLTEKTFDIPEAAAPVDSALLFGLAASRWSAGAGLAAGLFGMAEDMIQVGGGRLTSLAVDGTRIAGICIGEPLFVRASDDSVVVASEPYDDDPGWTEVPDRTLIEADLRGVTISPLPA
jgi:gamma-glutamyl hercynylcysteine S-oxide hydrolase